jgi:hypothetical protein
MPEIALMSVVGVAKSRSGAPPPRRLGRITTVAYDDFLQSDTAVATAVSYPGGDSLIGAFDQVAVEAIVDQATAAVGPASLEIHLAHSGDGFLWVRKDSLPLTSAPALSFTGKTYLDIGYDDGARPSLGFVRMELTLRAVTGPVRARIRLHVTANNLREQEFSLSMKNAGRHPMDVYDRCYPGGSRISMAKIRDLITYWRYFNQLQLDFNLGAAIVPRNQMVCFNAYSDYLLVERGAVVFSSRGVVEYYIDQARRRQGQSPPRTAGDPPPDVTLKYDDP